jgi:hypothetical protein
MLLRRAGSDVPLAPVASLAAVLVQVNLIVAPAINPRMAFRLAIQRMNDQMVTAPDVASWRLGETRIGAFSFYANRVFRDFTWKPALERHLKRHPKAYVLADTERLQESGLADSFELVYRDRVGTDELGLFRRK